MAFEIMLVLKGFYALGPASLLTFSGESSLRLFAQAEALGWTEPTQDKEDGYLQSIEREKARRGQ